MSFWKTKRVLITGAHGFLGKSLCSKLDCVILNPTRQEFDLLSQYKASKILRCYEPDIVIHLAARCGGIGANKKDPGSFFYENMLMGLNLIEACRYHHISKFVMVGTVCSYPKFCSVPFKEEDLWNGFPEETNAPYGIAKKTLLLMLQAYYQQYGMQSAYLIPANMYGPGDNFDLDTGHVIPAIMRKMQEAITSFRPAVELWGTGGASREFLYVDDCADAIIAACEKIDKPDPINIGTGKNIKISELATMIAKLVGFKGSIHWNKDFPDGQPERRLEVFKAKLLLNWKAKTELTEGLIKTYQWYSENILKKDKL